MKAETEIINDIATARQRRYPHLVPSTPQF